MKVHASARDDAGARAITVIAARIEARKASVVGGPLQAGSLDLATAYPSWAAVTIIASDKAIGASAGGHGTGRFLRALAKRMGAPSLE